MRDEIARALHDAKCRCADGPGRTEYNMAHAILPAVRKAQAGALREVAARYAITHPLDDWDAGYNAALETVRNEADNVEVAA